MEMLRKWLSWALMVSMSVLGLPLPAHAGMLSTEKAISGEQIAALTEMLDRSEVRAQLERYGVAADEVKARVASLTDEEAKLLAERIQELPAGGILGVLLTVFIILLITDILGLTKVFPFTRAVCDRGRC